MKLLTMAEIEARAVDDDVVSLPESWKVRRCVNILENEMPIDYFIYFSREAKGYSGTGRPQRGLVTASGDEGTPNEHGTGIFSGRSTSPRAVVSPLRRLGLGEVLRVSLRVSTSEVSANILQKTSTSEVAETSVLDLSALFRRHRCNQH
jgi:hypothetical protein